MEFTDDDDDHLDKEEQDDDDDEGGITIPTPTPLTTASSTISLIRNGTGSSVGGVLGVGGGGPHHHHAPTLNTTRYRECQKNHAVSIGGHAVDGCGEFMPAGEEGSFDALKCAACGCHRNFHRKEPEGAAAAPQTMHHAPGHVFAPPYYRTPVATTRHDGHVYAPHALAGYHHARPLALPSSSGGRVAEEMEEFSNPSSSGGGGGSRGKRFRTKFTPEQKERMAEFAERIGWRIQKQNEAAVLQFCQEVNVTRQVLKVWLHNNKHSLTSRKP